MKNDLDNEKQNNKDLAIENEKLKNDNLNITQENKRKVLDLESQDKELKQRNEATQNKLDNEFRNYHLLFDEKENVSHDFEKKYLNMKIK